MTETLNLSQAAKYVGVTRTSVYSREAQGKLTRTDTGFPREQLDEWKRERQARANAILAPLP